MIIFVEHGRIGNQLFQYIGLKMKAPHQMLVIIGCSELQRLFVNIEALFIDDEVILGRRRYSLLRRIISFLADARILGTITEDTNSTLYKTVLHRGLLQGIYVTREVYFQHKDMIDAIKWLPKFRPEILQQANYWWESKGLDIANTSPIFVHIRRGDYLKWPSREYPAALDLSWYRRAMREMQNMIKNPVFILMSDDLCYLRDNFYESENIIISNNASGVDMAIMSFCVAGIMSASTFAWWGGFLAKNNKQNEAPKIFIAPKYWAGHRSKQWYPKHFVSSWITYVEY